MTIGAGVTTATFAVTAIEDANSVNETVSVGVNAGGYGVQTVVVNVTDNDADYLVVAPAAMSLTEGGASGTATVYLSSPAGAGGQVVTLSSDMPGSVTVPVSVTIGAGVTTATFAVTAIEDWNSVSESVTITATGGAFGTDTPAVSVTDNDTPFLVVSPTLLNLVEGGVVGTVTVSLSQPAGIGGQIVTLSLG